MFEVKINLSIEAPELVNVLNNIITTIRSGDLTPPAMPQPNANPTMPSAPAATQQSPVAFPAAQGAASAATPVPDASAQTTAPDNPTPFVPTAPPTYTLDQLARAGGALVQAGKMDLCIALLAKYGVQTVNQLKPELFGAFATDLRALGAQL